MEGPATVAELAATFELPARQVQIGMWVLTHAGQAVPVGKMRNHDGSPGARCRNIYSLTDRGFAVQLRNRP